MKKRDIFEGRRQILKNKKELEEWAYKESRVKPVNLNEMQWMSLQYVISSICFHPKLRWKWQ
jgi:hypothetical protein